MTNKEALILLKNLSSQLDKVDYSDITDLLKYSIQKIPIPIAKLRTQTSIERARKDIGTNLFKRVDQLSYITDKDVIENILVEFGRANKPHEVLFYAAVESTLLPHKRITAIAEISKLYQDPDGVNLNGELYTVGNWSNSKELFLAEIVFAQNAIDINPDIKRAFEKQTELAKEHGTEDIEFYTDFLIFISEQFARRAKTHHDYKISTAYTELVLSKPDIDGIAFPSVQTQYTGQNIVLRPSVVDNYLSIAALATQWLHKNKAKMYFNNHKICLSPIDCQHDIQWIDIDPQYLALDGYIQNYLATPL